jgi:hypothetical protein
MIRLVGSAASSSDVKVFDINIPYLTIGQSSSIYVNHNQGKIPYNGYIYYGDMSFR